MAHAYADYAADAEAAGATPTFMGDEELSLANVLEVAFRNPRTGTADKAAEAWIAGISTFWGDPGVSFAGGGESGTANANAVTGHQDAFSSVFSHNKRSAKAQAKAFAQAVHAATQAVTVLLSPSATTVGLS